MSMDQFFTRDRANEGEKVKLGTPDGQETEFYLVIRSQWSDAFQKAKQEYQRDNMLAIAKDEPFDEMAANVKLAASLVAGWNLEEEFTPENVEKLLTNAPQLRAMIDRHASRDKHFFGKPSTDSTSGRSKS